MRQRFGYGYGCIEIEHLHVIDRDGFPKHSGRYRFTEEGLEAGAVEGFNNASHLNTPIPAVLQLRRCASQAQSGLASRFPLRRKPQSLPQSTCGLFVRARFMAARAGSRKARRYAQAGPVRQPVRAAAPIGVGSGGCSKPSCLESTMAQSSRARISALTSCLGEPALVQLHPDALSRSLEASS